MWDGFDNTAKRSALVAAGQSLCQRLEGARYALLRQRDPELAGALELADGFISGRRGVYGPSPFGDQYSAQHEQAYLAYLLTGPTRPEQLAVLTEQAIPGPAAAVAAEAAAALALMKPVPDVYGTMLQRTAQQLNATVATARLSFPGRYAVIDGEKIDTAETTDLKRLAALSPKLRAAGLTF